MKSSTTMNTKPTLCMLQPDHEWTVLGTMASELRRLGVSGRVTTDVQRHESSGAWTITSFVDGERIGDTLLIPCSTEPKDAVALMQGHALKVRNLLKLLEP